MPAGTKTRLQPVRASPALSTALSSPDVKTVDVTLHGPSMCERSAWTPSAGTTAMFKSRIANSFTRGQEAIKRDKGCPMPPAPPTTHTLNSPLGTFSPHTKEKQDMVVAFRKLVEI